jgi:hypothetical protein
MTPRTDPDTLAGRLRLLADRLDADGTFGGKVVADDVRAAADLLSGDIRYEYGHKFDPIPQLGTADEAVFMWTDTIRDTWPQNERGPWGLTKINSHPVKVMKRTIVTGPWVDQPEPDGGTPA